MFYLIAFYSNGKKKGRKKEGRKLIGVGKKKGGRKGKEKECGVRELWVYFLCRIGADHVCTLYKLQFFISLKAKYSIFQNLTTYKKL